MQILAATRSASTSRRQKWCCEASYRKARSRSTRILPGGALSLAWRSRGGLDELEAGDAIVITYRAELDGLPAIFLPPLAPGIEFEGVSDYADTPDVEDGDTARRSRSRR